MLTIIERVKQAMERADQARSVPEREQLQMVQEKIDELQARGALRRQRYSMPLPTETERQYHNMIAFRRSA
jgi:hypothetical protein